MEYASYLKLTGSSFPASELNVVLKSLLIFFSALVAKGYNTIKQVRMDSYLPVVLLEGNTKLRQVRMY